MSRLSDNLQRLETAKQAISSAIEEKGGIVNQGDGYSNFYDDILTIPPTKSVYAFLYITTSAGATITVSKGSTILPSQTSQSGEELMFEIPESGTWTITAVKSGETDVSKSISIGEQKDYYLNANFTKIYGVSWDKSSSTALSRTDDSATFVNPDPYVADGNHPGSSPFDNLMPWSGMVKETIDGNVLVKIPKFWYKITNTTNELKIQIADGPADGFKVSPAHQARNANESDRDYVYIGRYKCSSTDYKSQSGKTPKVSITRATARTSIKKLGTGYWQQDFAMFWTIRLLYLVEFANWNSQAVIGYGCGNMQYAQGTGASDSMPYHTGTMKTARNNYGVGTQYRWIEDLWGNVREWVDGIYFAGTNKKNVYIITDPSSFSDSSGGTLVGTRATFSDEIKDFFSPSEATLDWAMYSNAEYSDSNYSTYVTDSFGYYYGGVVLCVGGDYYLNQSYGLFYLNGIYSASDSYSSIGTRLMYLP